MYPRLSDIFQDLFGISFPIPIYSFGAMMAVAFLVAVWIMRKEFDRLYQEGRLGGVKVPVEGDKKGRKQVVSPSAIIGTLTIIAVVAGILGAKIFHILENFGTFLREPAAMLFSTGGLTFFGGLILAGFSIAWYVKKQGLDVATCADALAPVLILGYGIGRLGCHLAGDGDWGVASNIADKPGWLPLWLWAETYPRAIVGPPGMPVFPTPLYEFGMGVLFFAILWMVRKHPFKRGWLFSLYLVFAGAERFLIEQIRVNNLFNVFGLELTQAEIISSLLMLLGVIGLVKTTRKDSMEENKSHPAPAEE